jgi:hypothetical protein
LVSPFIPHWHIITSHIHTCSLRRGQSIHPLCLLFYPILCLFLNDFVVCSLI